MEGDAVAEDPGEAFGFPGVLLLSFSATGSTAFRKRSDQADPQGSTSRNQGYDTVKSLVYQ